MSACRELGFSLGQNLLNFSAKHDKKRTCVCTYLHTYKEAHIYLIWWVKLFQVSTFLWFCILFSGFRTFIPPFFSSPLCCGSMCSASAGRLCLVFINRSTSVSHFLPRRFYIQQIVFALHPYMVKGHIHTHKCVCVCGCVREIEFTTVLSPSS